MLTICLVKLISILLNYIDVRGKATNKLHVFKQKTKKKKEKPSWHYAQQSLREFFLSFTFMEPSRR